jgi:hypothetical protein
VHLICEWIRVLRVVNANYIDTCIWQDIFALYIFSLYVNELGFRILVSIYDCYS